MTSESALRVAGLRAGYGQTPILQGIDLDLKRGEIVSLIGRNGVGKTTILRCLMGQLPAAEGRIEFQGQDITRLSPDARARLGMGYVPTEEMVDLWPGNPALLMVKPLVG